MADTDTQMALRLNTATALLASTTLSALMDRLVYAKVLDEGDLQAIGQRVENNLAAVDDPAAKIALELLQRTRKGRG